MLYSICYVMYILQGVVIKLVVAGMPHISVAKNNYWKLYDDIDKMCRLDMILDDYVITCT